MNIFQKHAALNQLELTTDHALFGLVEEIFGLLPECKKPADIEELQGQFEIEADCLVDDIVAAIERELESPSPTLKGTPMASPTFVATFSDGQVTRMSVSTKLDRLDVGRGVRLAQAAYESRMKKQPRAITAAHFEQNGDVLQNYDADELTGIGEVSPEGRSKCTTPVQ